LRTNKNNYSYLLRLWDLHFHNRSLSPSARNGELTSEQQGALAHSQDSERSTCRELLFVDSAAVNANFEDDDAILLAQPDVDFRCLGMTRDVGQGLLKNAENRRGAFPIDQDVVVRQIQNVLGSGARAEFLRGPFDGGY